MPWVVNMQVVIANDADYTGNSSDHLGMHQLPLEACDDQQTLQSPCEIYT